MVVKIRFIEIFLLKNKQGRSAHILEENYGIPWSRRAAPLFLTFVYCVALFDTTSRALGERTELCWRTHREFLTSPPRISPSCPHCLSLWLGRGTIIGERGHCETGCHTCFWMDGNRWAPCLAVFYTDIVCTGGLGASSASLLPCFTGLVR